MNQFRDRELDRLLNNADDLLSNITVYETKTEETARKQEEEAARLKAEEEQRILEEQRRMAEKQRLEEEQKRLAKVLEQEDELVEAEVIERELAEAEALVRELQSAEAEVVDQKHQSAEAAVLKQGWKEQVAAADDLEMEWQQGQEFLTEESMPAFMKRNNSLFGCSLFSIVCFVYMEIITHLSIYGSIDTKILYPLLFAAGIGCMAGVVSSFFSKRWNTVLFCILLVLCSLYFDLQILCHAVWGTFLTLMDIPAGIQMLSRQGAAVIPGMTAVLPGMVLMFLPILLWAIVGRNRIRFEQSHWWNRLLMVAAGIIVIVVGILCLDLHGYEADSPYVCFYHFDSETQLEETGRQLGVTAVTGLELLEQFQK